MKKLKRYILNWLLALDRGLNVIFFLGDSRETISSRMAKWRHRPRGYKRWIGIGLCKFLDLLDPGHCDKARDDNVGDEGVIR